MSPMINFHAARVRDPKDFLDKPLATITLKGVEGIELVTGKLKKDGPGGPMVAQTYHFDKDKFTEKGAKKWMKRHKVKSILFEPAKEVAEQYKEDRMKEIANQILSELCISPGEKKRSKGQGRGLAFGQGKGPIGIPWIEKTRKEEEMGTASMAANVGTPSFDKVWSKVTDKKKKKVMGITEQKVIATTEGGSDDYGTVFKGSFEEITKNVREALKETKQYGDWQNIIATFPDKVYFSTYDSMQQKSRYFEVEYEIEDGIVTLGDSTEVVKKTEWIIKEQAEAIAAGLFPLTEVQELLEAKWTTKFINDLPDSAFAFIKSEGELDDDKKTKPRSLRYLPFKDADGEIDLPHLRNALARLPQTDLSDDEKKKALKVLEKAAKEAGVGKGKKTEGSK